MLTASDKQITAPSILREVNIKVTRKKLFHRNSHRMKSFQIGIFPVAMSPVVKIKHKLLKIGMH